jgi:adenylate kinase
MILEWLPVKIPSISTGEMLRAEIAAGTELGERTKAVIAAGGLVDDGIINQMLAARISKPDCAGGFMLDGYPRTAQQAVYLDSLLAQRNEPAPIVIHLDVPMDALVGRMMCRRQCGECGRMFNILSKRPKVPGKCDACGGPLRVRKDDREEVIKERLRTYELQTQPVLNHYYSGDYHHIGADMSQSYIFEEITRVLGPRVQSTR